MKIKNIFISSLLLIMAYTIFAFPVLAASYVCISRSDGIVQRTDSLLNLQASTNIGGQANAIAVGDDVNFDGHNELYVVRDDGQLFQLNGANLLQLTSNTGHWGATFRDISIGDDADGDGIRDVYVARMNYGDSNDGILVQFSGNNISQLSMLGHGNPLECLAVGNDLNGGGVGEVYIGTNEYFYPSINGGILYVDNGENPLTTNTSGLGYSGRSFNGIAVGPDITGDKVRDVFVVATSIPRPSEGILLGFNGANASSLGFWSAGWPLVDVAVGDDINGDRISDVYVTRADGLVACIDVTAMTQIGTWGNVYSTPRGLAVGEDLNGNGIRDIYVGRSDGVIMALDGKDFNTITSVGGFGNITDIAVSFDVEEGLIFYFPFDSHTEGWSDLGKIDVTQDKGTHVFSSGKVGQSLHVGGVSGGKSAVYNAESVLDFDQGTIAFWFKPDWNGTDSPGSDPHRMFTGVYASVAGFGTMELLYFYDTTSVIFGHYQYLPGTPNNGSWLYAPPANVSSWTAGTWYHVAITWNSLRKKIYINGSLVGTQTISAGFPIRPGDVFIVGSHSILNFRLANGAFDEMATWGRPLTAAEIRYLYIWPSVIGALVPNPPTPPSPTLKVNLDSEYLNLDFDKIYHPGQPVGFQFGLTNTDTQNRTWNFTYTVIDYWGNVVYTQVDTNRTLVPNTPQYYRIEFLPQAQGIMKINLHGERSDAGETFDEDIVIFAVVPQPKTLTDSRNSWFGVHTRWLDNTVWNRKRYLSACEKTGIHWVRILDFMNYTWWSEVQPSSQNDWVWYDPIIGEIRSYDLNILGVIFSTPLWATGLPPGTDYYLYRTCPPTDWNWFVTYVQNLTNHYKGNTIGIDYWEVWNEVEMFWAGTKSEYVGMLNIVNTHAKSMNPSAKVLCGGAFNQATRSYLTDILALGAFNSFDICSHHAYGSLGSVGWDVDSYTDNIYDSDISALNTIMQPYGTPKPIWNTEWANFGPTWIDNLKTPEIPPPWRQYRPYNHRHTASETVKGYVTMARRGVTKHFYYYLQDVSQKEAAHYHQSLLEYNGWPTPRLAAMAVCANMIDASVFERETTPMTNVSAYVFQDGPRAVAVIWNNKWSIPVNYVVPASGASFTVVDIMGKASPLSGDRQLALGVEPVYLYTLDLTALQLADLLN